MKAFIGTKLINAKPMTRAEYNTFRGWELLANENGADEGFLVEYVGVGQNPNTSEYSGYVSWSPKEVFELAYKPAETFADRLLIEYADLKNRLQKLSEFLNGKAFEKLSLEDQEDLREQQEAMSKYSSVLEKRIARIE